MKLLDAQELAWLNVQGVDEITRISQFSNALTNDVYLIITHKNERFIFKRLNRQARSDADRELEFLVQQLGAQYQLTPKVIAHNRHYKLQQYISGDLIPVDTVGMNELLATQLHRIHKMPALHAPKQRLAFELQRLKKQLPSNIDEQRFINMLKLATELDASSACDLLCHGDLSVNNILLGADKQLYILDWEYAVVACAAYDLAFCCCINEFSQKRSQVLIATYYNKIIEPKPYSLNFLQKECDLYLKMFTYINELWSVCFVENK